jgi:hypothetical protein
MQPIISSNICRCRHTKTMGRNKRLYNAYIQSVPKVLGHRRSRLFEKIQENTLYEEGNAIANNEFPVTRVWIVYLGRGVKPIHSSHISSKTSQRHCQDDMMAKGRHVSMFGESWSEGETCKTLNRSGDRNQLCFNIIIQKQLFSLAKHPQNYTWVLYITKVFHIQCIRSSHRCLSCCWHIWTRCRMLECTGCRAARVAAAHLACILSWSAAMLRSRLSYTKDCDSTGPCHSSGG